MRISYYGLIFDIYKIEDRLEKKLFRTLGRSRRTARYVISFQSGAEQNIESKKMYYFRNNEI